MDKMDSYNGRKGNKYTTRMIKRINRLRKRSHEMGGGWKVASKSVIFNSN